LLDVAITYDILKRQGAWFSYGDMKIGQGRESARTFLKENPKITAEIEKKVKEHVV